MPCARSMFDRYCKDAELNGKHRIDVKLSFLLYTAVLEKCHCIFICEFMKNAFSCFVLIQRKFHFCDFRRNEKLRIFSIIEKTGVSGGFPL